MKILRWIECRIWGVALLVFGLALTPLVFAQETLDYTGQGMNGAFATGFTTALPADVIQITGDVVLAQALNPNQANQLVTPVSYAFGGILTSSLAYLGNGNGYASNTFLFSTQNGNIVGWDIMLSNSNNATYTNASLISTQNGDTYTANQEPASCWFTHGMGCSIYSASNNVGGSWVDPPPTIKSTLTAPEFDGSRAITALLLLCGMTLVLKDSRRV